MIFIVRTKMKTKFVRTLFWIKLLQNFLMTEKDNRRLPYREFVSHFYGKFLEYSYKNSSLPLHKRKQLIICSDKVLESETTTVQYVLERSDITNARYLREIGKSAYSKWQSGQAFPNEIFQIVSKQLHLESYKWLDGESYDNRLSRMFLVIDKALEIKKAGLKNGALFEIQRIFDEISSEWRPVKRVDTREGSDMSADMVFDFYIPGPDERHCQPNIYDDEKSFRWMGHGLQSGSSLSDFKDSLSIDFDFSLGLKSYGCLLYTSPSPRD